ncbi:hypothetical protein L1987_69121 [Smallanthus sonchifolius]|uniref:Uncharacterized protein n=1 Tax=Smallanthus sonchifolius TaxID=185202 RepID=A0ACB9B6N5_9ASTR|nr:hypothetical protein L1987_69121 [Smallanthus sonchifolius]
MDVGEDDTNVFAGLSTGEAKPGIVGSVQFESGKPHKIRLFANADSWKPEKPENWFDSSRKVQEVSLFDPSEEALNDINGVRSGWSLAGGVAWRRERWKRRRRNRKCGGGGGGGGGGAAIVVCEREREISAVGEEPQGVL